MGGAWASPSKKTPQEKRQSINLLKSGKACRQIYRCCRLPNTSLLIRYCNNPTHLLNFNYLSYILSFKFTIYVPLLPAVKDVVVNIFFVVFNILLTLPDFSKNHNFLTL